MHTAGIVIVCKYGILSHWFGNDQLHELHKWGGKQARVPTTASFPPTLIHHLNVSDDVIWHERDLITGLCKILIFITSCRQNQSLKRHPLHQLIKVNSDRKPVCHTYLLGNHKWQRLTEMAHNWDLHSHYQQLRKKNYICWRKYSLTRKITYW